MGTFRFILLLVLIGTCVWLAIRLANDIGYQPDKSYREFKRIAGSNSPLVFASWLLWSAASEFMEFDPPEVEPPPPPPPEPTKLDHEAILAKVRMGLDALYPDHDNILDACIAAAKGWLERDYTPPEFGPPAKVGVDWEVKVAKAGQIERTIVAALANFLSKLPIDQTFSPFMVSIPDIATVHQVQDLHRDLSELFPNLYERFCRTAEWARAMTRTNPMLDKIGIDQVGERNSPAHVRMLFNHSAPLRDLYVGLAIPEELRFSGTHILGPQGTGKSTLLSNMLDVDLYKVDRGEATVIIFDSKGDDFLPYIKRLKAFAPGQPLHDRYVLIEPSGQLAINPLDIGKTTSHTIALMEYVLAGLLDTEPTLVQLNLLRKLILACKGIKGATLNTLHEMLVHGWQRYEPEILANEAVRDFFITRQFASADAKGTVDSLRWRIDELMSGTDFLKEMFRSPATKIDMGKLMDSGSVIAIDTSEAVLTAKGSEFIGRFFMALILAAAQQRAGRRPEDKLPVYVYIDEASTLIAKDQTVAKIVETCRSHNIAMIFAHQRMSQIKSEDVKDVLKNCAIHIARPLYDAKELAATFKLDDWPHLEDGQFMLHTRSMRTAIMVNVQNRSVKKWKQMSDAEFALVQAKMRRFNRDTFPEPEVEYPIAAEEPVDFQHDTDPKPWKPK